MQEGTEKRNPGRPREFDRDTALRAAMLVFWRQGYEGASLADLTEAMAISKPTLYAAFGDKESLLREALRTYLGLRSEQYAAALNRPTVREVAEAWLRLTGGVRQEDDVPPGCLLVQGALVGSQTSQVIQEEFASIRNEGTKQLEQRFHKAKQEGDLPGTWEPGPLAQYLSALASGLAVQSSGGVSCEVLNKAVDQVMENWPD
jgi:AcrR family transcriptional regulator